MYFIHCFFDFMEGFFALLFLSYFSYIFTIFHNLIPIFIQVIFSYFIEKKRIFKTIGIIFLTHGLVIFIANILFDIFNSIYQHSESLGFWNIVSSSSFNENITTILVGFLLLIIINCYFYKDLLIEKQYKKFTLLLLGYLLNLLVILSFMMKYNIFFILG